MHKPDEVAASVSLQRIVPLYLDPGGDNWRYWYVLQYLTANGSAKRRTWRPFEEARAFARSLGLPHERAWKQWRKTGARPYDIPANPDQTYKRRGWVSWGDWLGTGRAPKYQGVYRPFEEARTLARSLMLQNCQAWREWAKTDAKPPDIPACPDRVYKECGWISYGDWLGTRYVSPRSYRPFEQARLFVRSLGLHNQKEWRKWAKTAAKPRDIPSTPDHAYARKGWSSWGDWLGTGTVASFYRTYRPFEDARAFVHSLGLRSQSEWYAWVHTTSRPQDIPASPSYCYKDRGWSSWGDWLGTGTVASSHRVFRPFAAARAFARSAGFASISAWQAWARTAARPTDIPSNPHQVYRDAGWAGWGDWLGTGIVATYQRTYRAFEEARAFARSSGLSSRNAWRAWAKTAARPADIPADPTDTYRKQGWAGWGDWLGTGTIAPSRRSFRPFEEARTFAHSLGLRDLRAWQAWSKTTARPGDIPANPSAVYKGRGWAGWGDWLGTRATRGGRQSPMAKV